MGERIKSYEYTMNTHVYVIPYSVVREPREEDPQGHFVVTVTDVCKLGLLGGKVEEGEGPLDALCREFHEETGFRLEQTYLENVGVYSVDDHGWKTENHVYAYRCRTDTLRVDHKENAGYIRVPITHARQPRFLSKALGRFFQTFPLTDIVRRSIKDFLIGKRFCRETFFEHLKLT